MLRTGETAFTELLGPESMPGAEREGS
jgi:hypothetical protein